ncbi:MAG: chorismate mutase [Cyanobacteria bacterium QS_8_64_29]|nr:MAG: chorismate mutase [Cyanobacteria bacterium QS_8_64_29]
MAGVARVQAIRGATTAADNTAEAIREAVAELLDDLERRNPLIPDETISAVFTVTSDLDAVFPAAIARQRHHWESVALLDVQQMRVEGSLARCIRVLIHVNAPSPHCGIAHSYLRQAQHLRPDRSLSPPPGTAAAPPDPS